MSSATHSDLTTGSDPTIRVFALLLGLLAAGVGFVFLWEWYAIGVAADPSAIRSYHFGADSMIEKGGSHYRSAEVYSASALRTALFFLPALIVAGLAVVRSSSKALATSAGLLVFALGGAWLL